MAGTYWTASDLPNLSGRRAVVTGASGGLGEVIAGELARAGATVTLAVRDMVKGRVAAARMSGRTDVRPLDLADLASVRAFAADWTTHGAEASRRSASWSRSSSVHHRPTSWTPTGSPAAVTPKDRATAGSR